MNIKQFAIRYLVSEGCTQEDSEKIVQTLMETKEALKMVWWDTTQMYTETEIGSLKRILSRSSATYKE